MLRREISAVSLCCKRSEGSLASPKSVASSDQIRDPHDNSRLPLLFGKTGIYMGAYKGKNEAVIKNKEEDICQTVLQKPQPVTVPRDSLVIQQ